MLEQAIVLLIRLYQLFLSPFLGGQCRFEPSCSRYALVAVQRFGAGRGSWLTLKRLSRCHPFCTHHGYDPPPELESPASLESQALLNPSVLRSSEPAPAGNG